MSSNPGGSHLLLYCDVTFRCNYKCPYCYLGEQTTAGDMFVRFSPDAWMSAFSRQFSRRRLQFEINGGEPLVYDPTMDFLKLLVDSADVDDIRMNTNGTTIKKLVKQLPSPKIRLMVTYHPSQVKLERFLAQVQLAQDAGLLDMVNYVAVPDNFKRDDIRAMVEDFDRRGIFLDVSYDWLRVNDYSTSDLRYLISLRTRRDSAFLMKCETLGKPCAAGLEYAEFLPSGELRRCQGTMPLGNVFGRVRLLERPAPCHLPTCTCTDRYTNLLSWHGEGDHHLTRYVARNRAHRRELPGSDWTLRLDDRALSAMVHPRYSLHAHFVKAKLLLENTLDRGKRKLLRTLRLNHAEHARKGKLDV